MKGLLIKDMKLMRGQIMFLIILPVVGALIVVPTGELNMGFGYITSVSGLIAVTTINYDSYDNGYSFLFTLPVSRKEYVKEKYAFALMSSAIMMLAIGALLWILSAAVHRGNVYSLTDFMGELWSAYMIALAALSFLLPIFLEFGAEKSRYFILIICGVFLAVMVGVSMGMDETLEGIFAIKLKKIIFFILSVVLLAGSYRVSCSIMEQKDF